MKRFSTKRIIALMAASMMAFSMTACAGKPAEQPKEEAKAEAAKEEAKPEEKKEEAPAEEKKEEAAPAAEGKGVQFPLKDQITVKIWQPFTSDYIKDLNENLVYVNKQKLTNMKFEWIYPAAGQSAESYNLLIASDDLPDVFQSPPLYTGGLDKAIKDEVYVNLNDYLPDYGPAYKALLESNEEIGRQMKTDEGNIPGFYCVQLIEEQPWHGLITRKDWLEELNGGKTPETIDEMYKYMTAIKEKKNAIPFTFENKDGIWFGFECGAFISAFDTTTNWFNKDGVATFGAIEPSYKDFLTTMNKWYKEGLIDPDFATRDADSVNALFTSGKSGIKDVSYGDFENLNKAGKEIDPKFSIFGMKNVSMEAGKPIHFRQTNFHNKNGAAFITTANKHIPETVAWYDYNFTTEGFLLYNYGEEKTSWDWKEGPVPAIDKGFFPADIRDQNKHPEFNDFMTKNPDGTPFWTLIQKYKVHQEAYLRDPMAYGYMADDIQQSMTDWQSVGNDWMMPQTILTDEESKATATKQTDIDTFYRTKTINYIMGTESLDTFDDYVAQVKSMGADEIQKARQAALERYLNRK